MTRLGRLAAVLAVLVFALATICNGADSPEFTLGSATGIPGGEVKVPVYVTLSGGQQFERVLATIDYPAVLSYQKVAADKDAAENGVAINGKVMGSQTGEQMRRIEMTVTGGKGKPLPTLVIGSLVFVVDKKAKQQRVTISATEIKGVLKGSGTEVKVHGNPGNIAILESAIQPQPMTGCFFFSH
jgi:sporulation-control protein spo0M